MPAGMAHSLHVTGDTGRRSSNPAACCRCKIAPFFASAGLTAFAISAKSSSIIWHPMCLRGFAEMNAAVFVKSG